jgi:hypothetical protein
MIASMGIRSAEHKLTISCAFDSLHLDWTGSGANQSDLGRLHRDFEEWSAGEGATKFSQAEFSQLIDDEVRVPPRACLAGNERRQDNRGASGIASLTPPLSALIRNPTIPRPRNPWERKSMRTLLHLIIPRWGGSCSNAMGFRPRKQN